MIFTSILLVFAASVRARAVPPDVTIANTFEATLHFQQLVNSEIHLSYLDFYLLENLECFHLRWMNKGFYLLVLVWCEQNNLKLALRPEKEESVKRRIS